MARTCFATFPIAQMVRNPKGAVPEMGNPDQSNESVLWKNRIAVNDFVPVHQTTPTKVIDSASGSDGLETWATPFSSPQKQLDTQPKKEAIDASAHLAKLIQPHSKTKDPQMATTSKEPTTPKLVEMMDTFEPSSSAPRRAPTAQMVPLPPNTAVTTAPAGPVTSETSTNSLFGPRPSSMTLSNSKAFFPATASPSLMVAPIIPSSSTAALKKSAIGKCTPKKRKITMTPATAIAPSAAHVQNTKLLSSAKNHTNGVKKRQRIRTSSPPKSASAPESVPEEKRGRGRPRTRPEEQPLQENGQHRSPVQPSLPLPRTCFSNQSNSSLFAPSAFPLQQAQAITFNINGDSQPRFCSEEPRLWPGCGDYVASLLYSNSKPETIHSEPIRACTNHAAHQDLHKPQGHGVCTTCRYSAHRHIRRTRPELLGPTWWPLCKACGDNQLLHTDPNQKGCSCGKVWLCFSCQMQEVEKRKMRDRVEAESRRRSFVGEGKDGQDKTVILGHVCECGGEIGPNTTLLKCVGCQGMIVGRLDPQLAIAREIALTNTALAWT